MDGVLALVKAFDKEFSSSDTILEVVSKSSFICFRAEEVFIGVVNAESRQVFVVELDAPGAVFWDEGCFGLYYLVGLFWTERRTWTRLKLGDVLGCFFDAVERDF